MNLKPCPFCGSTNLKVSKPSQSTFEQYEPSQHARIACSDCPAEMEVKLWNNPKSLEDVMFKWNTRAE